MSSIRSGLLTACRARTTASRTFRLGIPSESQSSRLEALGLNLQHNQFPIQPASLRSGCMIASAIRRTRSGVIPVRSQTAGVGVEYPIGMSAWRSPQHEQVNPATLDMSRSLGSAAGAAHAEADGGVHPTPWVEPHPVACGRMSVGWVRLWPCLEWCSVSSQKCPMTRSMRPMSLPRRIGCG